MNHKNDPRDWLTAMAKRRITAVEIADILGVSRTTANARIAKGVSADDLIEICRGLGINPVEALAELGYLQHGEVMSFMDMGGQLLDTAEDGDLALELARRLNPATRAPIIDELASRRAKSNSRTPVVRSGWEDSGIPDDAVADSSPEVGGTPDDYDM